jgi:hypothetical protein
MYCLSEFAVSEGRPKYLTLTPPTDVEALIVSPPSLAV